MNPLLRSARMGAVILLVIFTSALQAADPAVVDDFSNAGQTARGAGRLLFNDQDAGGHSKAIQRCANGMLMVEGELVPGRGAPAFISIPLLLAPDARPQDVSAYTGVRLRVKLGKGILSVQVASADVTNFDYHAVPVVGRRGEFVEARVPFKALKRAWSEPIPLNTKTVVSVNLIVVGMVAGPFGYEVDEIGFY